MSKEQLGILSELIILLFLDVEASVYLTSSLTLSHSSSCHCPLLSPCSMVGVDMFSTTAVSYAHFASNYTRAYWNKSGNLFHDLLIRGFSDKVVKTNRSSNLCNWRQKGTSSESSVSMSPKCSRQTRIFRFQRKGYLIVCGQQITTFLKFTSSFTLYSLHLFIEEIIIDADCGASQLPTPFLTPSLRPI